jgi:hypothetical protein
MRLLRICVFCGRDTIAENPHEGTICFDCKSNAQLLADLETGRKWRENSSLEKWFPFTAERVAEFEELYRLVENYMCAESSSPEVAAHYHDLCKWFATHKRPNGSEPRKPQDL